MKSKASQILAGASLLIALSVAPAMAAVTTFEGLLSSPGTFNNNAGTNGAFNIGGARFSNSYTPDPLYPSWHGFAISNTTDTTTASYTNYSSFPGGGASGSSTYALSYDGYTERASIKFATALNLNGLGASITNATYTGLIMQNGDPINGFSKKFGGTSGNDADYFKLTISGFAAGAAAGTPVDFFLADFRFANNSQDYIVNQWKYVDFSALGTVDEIRFSYSSSDVNARGEINTPTYFAMDNFLAVPEPSAMMLAVVGSFGLLARRRR